MKTKWSEEDATIIQAIAWRITAEMAKHERSGVAMKLAHWPHRLFQPAQRWTAALNT